MAKLRKGKYYRDDGSVLYMGQFVEINSHVVKNKSKRIRESFELGFTRLGMIVGFRYVPFNWEYKYSSGYDYYHGSYEYEDGYTFLEGRWVALVSLYPTQKPWSVLPEEIKLGVEARLEDLEFCPSDRKAQKKFYKENPQLFPRDEKGRFIKLESDYENMLEKLG